MKKDFLSFVEQPNPRHVTRRWHVRGAVASLGWIEWRATWRAYVFAPREATVYDTACLRVIADWCETHTAHQREAAKARPEARQP